MTRQRSILGQLRRDSYRFARDLGNVQAGLKGPGAYGKRVVRRAVYRNTSKGTRRLLRVFGL